MWRGATVAILTLLLSGASGCVNDTQRAVAAAGAAAVSWAATGGCRSTGCPYPAVCDMDTGRCERASCSEGGCPKGSVCNSASGRCEETRVPPEPPLRGLGWYLLSPRLHFTPPPLYPNPATVPPPSAGPAVPVPPGRSAPTPVSGAW